MLLGKRTCEGNVLQELSLLAEEELRRGDVQHVVSLGEVVWKVIYRQDPVAESLGFLLRQTIGYIEKLDCTSSQH